MILHATLYEESGQIYGGDEYTGYWGLWLQIGGTPHSGKWYYWQKGLGRTRNSGRFRMHVY